MTAEKVFKIIWGLALMVVGGVGGILWIGFCLGSVVGFILLAIFAPTILVLPFGVFIYGKEVLKEGFYSPEDYGDYQGINEPDAGRFINPIYAGVEKKEVKATAEDCIDENQEPAIVEASIEAEKDTEDLASLFNNAVAVYKANREYESYVAYINSKDSFLDENDSLCPYLEDILNTPSESSELIQSNLKSIRADGLLIDINNVVDLQLNGTRLYLQTEYTGNILVATYPSVEEAREDMLLYEGTLKNPDAMVVNVRNDGRLQVFGSDSDEYSELQLSFPISDDDY